MSYFLKHTSISYVSHQELQIDGCKFCVLLCKRMMVSLQYFVDFSLKLRTINCENKSLKPSTCAEVQTT
jgi:hypothetical protein